VLAYFDAEKYRDFPGRIRVERMSGKTSTEPVLFKSIIEK